MCRVVIVLAAFVAVGGFVASDAFAKSHRRHRHAHHHVRRHHRRRHKHHALPRNHGTAVATSGTTAHGQFVRPLAINTNQSNNWSGYNQGSLEQGGTPPKLFTSVGGDWTVPTVTQHTAGQDEYSSHWIGIGGGCIDASCTDTDATLIQTGTEQDVSASGTPSYSAWWEIIPGPSMTITNMAIHPGDKIAASIKQAAPAVWTITIRDSSDGQSYTTTVPYASGEDTAEWIQETPLILGTNAGFAALPNLTSPVFDLATTNGTSAKLRSSEEMDLVDSSGKVIGAPSAPDPDADGFNVCTWAATCTAPSGS
jgi:hypothetical protein